MHVREALYEPISYKGSLSSHNFLHFDIHIFSSIERLWTYSNHAKSRNHEVCLNWWHKFAITVIIAFISWTKRVRKTRKLHKYKKPSHLKTYKTNKIGSCKTVMYRNGTVNNVLVQKRYTQKKILYYRKSEKNHKNPLIEYDTKQHN